MAMYRHLRDEAVALLSGKPIPQRPYALCVVGEQFESELYALGLPKDIILAASRAWTVEVLSAVNLKERRA
jgi:hypothetical protein